MKNIKHIHLIAAFISFFMPLVLYIYTFSSSIDFQDSAEFALVTFLGSVAHPPGTPAYVFFGWLCSKVGLLLTNDHIFIITLFSAISMSLAMVFTYFTIAKIIESIPQHSLSNLKISFISLTTTLSMAFGNTLWNWANTIEVYSFQILCASVMLYGLTCFNIYRKYKYLAFAAIGYGMGLANHHLSFIVFAPFILFFFLENFFYKQTQGISKPRHNNKKSKIQILFTYIKEVLMSKHFIFLTVLTTLVTAAFYGWMMYRATFDYLFEFGKPDTLSNLWYHVSGKIFNRQFISEVGGKSVFLIKTTYFSYLIFYQYLCFLPFLLIGIFYLIKNKLINLLLCIGLYFLINIFYHLQRPSTGSDLEGHIIFALYLFGFIICFGLYYAIRNFKYYWVLVILVFFQVQTNFALNDKRQYNVSESLMNELDKISPPSSIIIMSNWALINQYYYYRIVKNLRPDLVVLNYDLKFGNYNILKMNYPDFYKKIEKEYMCFINELAEKHPEEIYNTGLTLSDKTLTESYKRLFVKIKKNAEKENITYMFDPYAYYTLGIKKLIEQDFSVFLSGYLISNMPTEIEQDFLKLNNEWINSPMLFNDPAATEQLIMLEIAIDIYIDFYTNTHDYANLNQAIEARNKIRNIEKKMEKNMPHIFFNKFRIFKK